MTWKLVIKGEKREKNGPRMRERIAGRWRRIRDANSRHGASYRRETPAIFYRENRCQCAREGFIIRVGFLWVRPHFDAKGHVE